MNFNLTENQKMLQEMARKFAQKEITPEKIAEHEKMKKFPKELFSKLAELGLAGITINSKYNGAEMDTVSLTIAIEEVSKVFASLGINLLAHNLGAIAVELFGTAEQKEKFLSAVSIGDKICTVGLLDANYKTNKAEEIADGYVINGKHFIVNGEIADLYIIFSVLNGKVSAFILEKEAKGKEINNIETMGLNSSSFSELMLKGCKLSKENIMKDDINIEEIISIGRIGISALGIGISQACLDSSIEYSKKRVQFDEPICNFNLMQEMLTEMEMQTSGARLLTYNAAFLRDQKQSFSKEATIAKLYSSQSVVKSALSAIQIHGGYGYTKDYAVERYFRDAKATELLFGTTELHKTEIAKTLIK